MLFSRQSYSSPQILIQFQSSHTIYFNYPTLSYPNYTIYSIYPSHKWIVHEIPIKNQPPSNHQKSPMVDIFIPSDVPMQNSLSSKQIYKMILTYYQTLIHFCETFVWLQIDVPLVRKNNSINKLNTKLMVTKTFFSASLKENEFCQEIKNLIFYFRESFQRAAKDFLTTGFDYLRDQVEYFKKTLQDPDFDEYLENKTVKYKV